MRLSKLETTKEQTPRQMGIYQEVEFFSDDLSSFGEEKIIESKLLFHGAFAAQETEETARNWDLRLQVIHLGDFWAGYKSYPERNRQAGVGFLDADRNEEPDWNLTPNNYVERNGKSGGNPINSNILAIKTEDSVVILYRHWGSNESRQYPERLRDVDNELNILRTGGYSILRFPTEQWIRITERRNLKEWEKEFKISSARIVGGWQGFGNI